MKRLRILGSRGKRAVLSSGIQSSRVAETVCGKSERTKQQGRIGRTDTKTEKVNGEDGEYARGFGEKKVVHVGEKRKYDESERNPTKEKI